MAEKVLSVIHQHLMGVMIIICFGVEEFRKQQIKNSKTHSFSVLFLFLAVIWIQLVLNFHILCF